MARLLVIAAATAELSYAMPAQSDYEGVQLINRGKRQSPPSRVRTGSTIMPDGSIDQEWKNFVVLPGDHFQDRAGFQTVISGDSSTVAVASPMANSWAGSEHTGSVSIYKREGVEWHRAGDAIYGDTAHEQSGYAIALDFTGDSIVIGSPYWNRTNTWDASYNQSVPYCGQVRVFTFEDGAWSQLGRPIRGTQAGAKCGFSVHMGGHGRNIVLGCPRAKDYAHVRPNAGMVKAFKYSEAESKWVSKGSPIYGNTTNIMAGVRVSMSGLSDTMAFIAPGSNDNDPSPGRVRVFSYVGDPPEGDWEPKGEPIINWDENDNRGRCMAMSRDGMNVIIGSPTRNGSGHARVYGYDEGSNAWVQRGDPVQGGGAYHTVGTSVAINSEGTIIALGAPFNSHNGKTAGRVRVYYWNADRTKNGLPASGWSLKGQTLDGEEGDTNGFSVHITGKGNMITIGAPQYKWKRDKDHLMFNAAVEPPLDYDDEKDVPDEDEADDEAEEDEEDERLTGKTPYEEDASSHMLSANSHRKHVALSNVPTDRLDTAASSPNKQESSGGDAVGKQNSIPSLPQRPPPKNKGNGRARVLGAFECMFQGDIEPPDNPYLES